MQKINTHLLPQEERFLARLVKMAPHPGAVVGLEIGSFPGQSTQITAPLCGQLWIIEPQLAEPAKMAAWRENHPEPPLGFQFFPCRSDQFQPPTGLMFDFMFIDGDHERAGVEFDIRLCLPMLGDGGIIAFHDYEWRWEFGHILKGQWPGVKQAVDGYLVNPDFERIAEPNPGSIAAFRMVKLCVIHDCGRVGLGRFRHPNGDGGIK